MGYTPPRWGGIPPYGCILLYGGIPPIRWYTTLWGYTPIWGVYTPYGWYTHTWGVYPFLGVYLLYRGIPLIRGYTRLVGVYLIWGVYRPYGGIPPHEGIPIYGGIPSIWEYTPNMGVYDLACFWFWHLSGRSGIRCFMLCLRSSWSCQHLHTSLESAFEGNAACACGMQ